MHIQKLKNKVLQLAMQGKLVVQDKNDESANVLLKEIKIEREGLIQERTIKKEKSLPFISKDEMPFKLPPGWEWARLGDVSLINMGQSPKGDTVNDEEGIEFHQGKICFGDRNLRKSDRYTTDPKRIARPDDVLLSMRAPVGSINITTRQVCIGRGLCAISSLGNISKEYYYYTILAFKEYLTSRATGTTFLAVTAKVVKEMIVPIPPLEEQSRIVGKIDKIFSLMEELDSDKDELLKTISLTRKTILQEAVRGKLVSQSLDDDEPASDLLENIKEEKENLIEEGKIKRVKLLPNITEEEIPYQLPKGWEWSRLGNASLVMMGQSPKGDSVNDKEGVEFHQGKTSFGEKYLKSSDKYTISPNKISKKGDVLLSVRAPVGTLNITDREVCIGRGLCAISSLGNIETEFYFYIVSAFEDYLHERSTGTTFLAVKASVVNEMIIPIPPLKEQKRIVKKINTLMNLCDEIESQISDSEIMTL